jgi:hypothetical protein
MKLDVTRVIPWKVFNRTNCMNGYSQMPEVSGNPETSVMHIEDEYRGL